MTCNRHYVVLVTFFSRNPFTLCYLKPEINGKTAFIENEAFFGCFNQQNWLSFTDV